jgi:hypothetical protein
MAAKMAQIVTVPIARPPLMGPIHLYIIVYRSLAIPDFSSILPIKINMGMARRTKLLAFVKVRFATICNAWGPQRKYVAMTAVPPRLKTTGRPMARKTRKRPKTRRVRYSILISLAPFP